MEPRRLRWRKASYSNANGGACVEVAPTQGTVAVRDSTDPAGPRLAFTSQEWREFTRRIRQGRPGLA